MATYDGGAASRLAYAQHAHLSSMHAGFHEVPPVNVNIPMNMLGPVPQMHNAHTSMPFLPIQVPDALIKPMMASPAAVATVTTAPGVVGSDRPTVTVPEEMYKVLSESETFADGDMVSTCCNCKFTNTIVDIKWNKAKNKLRCIDEFMQILTKQISFNLVPDPSRSLPGGQPSALPPSVLCAQPQSDVYNLKSNLSANAQEFRPIQAHKQTNLHHEDQLHQQPHNTAMMTSTVVVSTNKDMYLSHNNNNNSTNNNNNNNNNVVHNDDSTLRVMPSNEPLLDINDSATLESGIDSGVHDSGVSDSGVTDPAVTDSVPDRYAIHVDDACNVCETDSLKSEKDGKKKSRKKRPKAPKSQKSEDGSMDNLLCDSVNDNKNFDYANMVVNSSSSDTHYTVAGRNNNNNNNNTTTSSSNSSQISIASRHRSGSSGKGMQQNRSHMNDVAAAGERPRPHLTGGKPQRSVVDGRRPNSRNNNNNNSYSNRDDTSMEKRNGIEADRSICERNDRIPSSSARGGARNSSGPPNAAGRRGPINDMANNCEGPLPPSARGHSANRRSSNNNNNNNGNGSAYPYNSNNSGGNSRKFANNGPPSATSLANVTRSSSYGSVIREVDGNLFNAPDDFSLAHCVAEDLSMSAGIAVQFKKEFQCVGELLDQRKRVGQVAVLQNANRFIFYLITKQFSNGKPTMGDMRRTLFELREECVRLGVKKLAMPRIGCGLDRLMWRDVRDALNDTFRPTDIEVVVYNFKEEEDSFDSSSSHSKNSASLATSSSSTASSSSSLVRKLPPVRYRDYPLVRIEQCTGLVVFGTTSGYMDDSCQRLNTKHTFKQPYQEQCQKMAVGKVIEIQPPSGERVFVFLIRENEKAPFSFKNLESCVVEFNPLFKKLGWSFVGFDYVVDPKDPIITEKIVTIFRNHIYFAVEIYVCNDPSAAPPHNSNNSHKFNAFGRRS